MTEKRYNARRNEDNNDFQDRLKAELEDIIGIVHTDEPTDSVELKKEYYREQSKNKHHTYLDYSKDKYIGSFFCNDVMLRTDEVVELLNENEQLKEALRELKEIGDYQAMVIQESYDEIDNKIADLTEAKIKSFQNGDEELLGKIKFSIQVLRELKE